MNDTYKIPSGSWRKTMRHVTEQLAIWDIIDPLTDFCPEVGCDLRAECMRQNPGPEALCFKEGDDANSQR